MPTLLAVREATDLLLALDLINARERQRCLDLFEQQFAFADTLAACDSLHIHIKVDDTRTLPRESFLQAGCQLDYSKEGFDKYLFPAGVNLIFSSIVVSQEELAETDQTRRKRPFVDHFGIDLRDESENVKRLFDTIPQISAKLGWEEVPQGEDGQGVHCCHVEVSEKHWVFPGPTAPAPQVPMEFAFGSLKVNEVSGGCDLRPMSPARRKTMGDAIPTCGN